MKVLSAQNANIGLIVVLHFTMGYNLKFSHTLRDATELLPQNVSQASLPTQYSAIKQICTGPGSLSYKSNKQEKDKKIKSEK